MTPILEKLIPNHKNFRYFVQLIVFTLLGTAVALLFIRPGTAQQGLAAGLGWNGRAGQKRVVPEKRMTGVILLGWGWSDVLVPEQL